MSTPGDPPVGPGPDGSAPEGQERPLSELPGIAAFASMGMTIAICEAVGVFGGLWLDHVLHIAPAGLLFGIVLGTVVAVLSVVKQVRRFL